MTTVKVKLSYSDSQNYKDEYIVLTKNVLCFGLFASAIGERRY